MRFYVRSIVRRAGIRSDEMSRAMLDRLRRLSNRKRRSTLAGVKMLGDCRRWFGGRSVAIGSVVLAGAVDRTVCRAQARVLCHSFRWGMHYVENAVRHGFWLGLR